MACNDKISLTCGDKQYAKCITFESAIPEYSELQCPNVEEVLSEHYDLITDIRENNNFSNLGNSCLTYPSGTLTAAQVALVFETKICQLVTTIATMQTTITTMQAQISDLQQNNCP